MGVGGRRLRRYWQCDDENGATVAGAAAAGAGAAAAEEEKSGGRMCGPEPTECLVCSPTTGNAAASMDRDGETHQHG